MSRGRFISVEGIDGSGKSTQADLLASALEGTGLEVVRTREPGGTPLGEALREIVLAEDVPIHGSSEVFLFAAARAQLVRDVIRPALEAGAWVVCDRFLDSSAAYQGGGRHLGLDAVIDTNGIAVEGTMPDRTILLDISPERAAERAEAESDRIEDEGIVLQERVAAAYRELAERSPERIRAVYGDRDERDIHREVFRLVEEWL